MFSSCPQAHRSLEDMSADLNQQFGVELSKEALHKRFTPQCAEFFKELIAEQLTSLFPFSKSKASQNVFKGIKIKDSTSFSLPNNCNGSYPGYGNFGKQNGLMKIQYEYDLLNGNWESISLTNRKENDQKNSNESLDTIISEVLYIRDLGYITPKYLKAVINTSAYFLNRLPPQAGVYNLDQQRITWKSIDQKFKKCQTESLSFDVCIYEKHMIPCRLIIQRLNDAEYVKRLKHAEKSAKSRNIGVTDEHKIRCRYNTYITNVIQEILPDKEVRKVYYLRWQIELVFKTWKSFFGINRVKKVKKERLECQILAQLLWVMINWKLFAVCKNHVHKQSPPVIISMIKFFKRCLTFSASLREVILTPDKLNKWLENVFLPAINNTACETPKSKISHHQVMKKLLS